MARPKKGQGKPVDEDGVPLPEEEGIASEHEAEIPPLEEEAAPPVAQNLFSSGKVKQARFGPMDAFLASPKPLKPPRRSK